MDQLNNESNDPYILVVLIHDNYLRCYRRIPV